MDSTIPGISMKYFFLLSGLILFNACQKNEYAAGTLVKQGATYETGAVLPELRYIKNDTALVVLYPNARVFYLDLKIKNSEQYIDMLRSAEKNSLPVRARIFTRPYSLTGEEISEIYPPTKKDISDFKAAMRP